MVDIWTTPLDQITPEIRKEMYKEDRSRAFKLLVRPKCLKPPGRPPGKSNKVIDNGRLAQLPDSLSGIDKLTKKLLGAIEDKLEDANVLDIAKTIDILGDVKSKALKDSLSIQAANYTPTVITQENKEEPVIQQYDKPSVEISSMDNDKQPDRSTEYKQIN